MAKDESQGYLPGKCNIGPKEIKKRYLTGFIGFVIAAILAVFLSISKVNYLFFILLIFPLFLGFIGFYQGYKRFCVANAIAGIYVFSDTKKGSIKDKKSHRIDLKKALILITYSFISAALLTMVMTLIAYYLVV
ncbi:MAG: hypothetical protein OH338_05335 [Candidatus Parvarchaeota archaeon]|nr:hypothetical protein [Candidatus Parvarchaeota archaeon]MCW1294293.1 hypothetical protein [Candidatus Parvarchaeum tengchongense]MCW1295355.1 hypothetical protein [Candidatus Parvarchaeum tengchongense]MCW1299674.1 hypothetical protein [Candidatus Parvarchaeum tengchongense]MCW1312820.1 hypothetical protein [Candidatus Parvarchaeum tengchongense]